MRNCNVVYDLPCDLVLVVEQQTPENVLGGFDLPVHYGSDPDSCLVLAELEHLLEQEIEGEHPVVASPEDVLELRI